MKIPEKYKECFHYVSTGNRTTLSDAQTKLYIRAINDLYYVDVDRGIIKNIRDNIRKCDFLCYVEVNMNCHLIELKGTNIDAAYKQLIETIKHIEANHDVSFLTHDLQRLDAYIVSPQRQIIPKGVNESARSLARELARKCQKRPKKIDSLLYYVKVLPKQKVLSMKEGHILCSNEAPLEL